MAAPARKKRPLSRRWWCSTESNISTDTSVDILLNSIKDDTGGVPVGALMLPQSELDNLCCSVLRKHFKGLSLFRTVESIPNGNLLVHLTPEVVMFVEENKTKEMANLFADHNFTYFPGLRVMDTTRFDMRHPWKAKDEEVHCFSRPPLFTFAEIFAGIGGFRLGLESLGGKCILASEIDRNAVATYRENWPSSSDISNDDDKYFKTTTNNDIVIGDISEYSSIVLPNFDILTAGFPCQPFSVRGHQDSLESNLGQLYKELVRLLRSKKPKAFLFENVVGLITVEGGSRSSLYPASTARQQNRSDGDVGQNKNQGLGTQEGGETREEDEGGGGGGGEDVRVEAQRQQPRWSPQDSTNTEFLPGRAFTTILEEFQNQGYDVSWRVLNAAHWVPQNRERVYIVGLRSDLNADPIDWNDVTVHRKVNRDNVEAERRMPTVRDILEKHNQAAVSAACLTPEQWRAVKTRCQNKKKRKYENSGIGKKELDDDDDDWLDSVKINIDHIAPCLISSYHGASNYSTKFIFEKEDEDENNGVNPSCPRFFTPRECARLMGFPEHFKILNQDSEQGRGLFYHQIGNAVCPPVIEAISKQILQVLHSS